MIRQLRRDKSLVSRLAQRGRDGCSNIDSGDMANHHKRFPLSHLPALASQ
jgi:hypothetical protein